MPPPAVTGLLIGERWPPENSQEGEGGEDRAVRMARFAILSRKSHALTSIRAMPTPDMGSGDASSKCSSLSRAPEVASADMFKTPFNKILLWSSGFIATLVEPDWPEPEILRT
jgi:hypothetical protein